MTRLLATLLLLAALPPPTAANPARKPAPAAARQAVATIDADAEARWASFRLTPGNQLMFELEINGERARAILDTGVSHSVVSPQFASRAGLKPAGRDRAIAIGGEVALQWADPGTIRLAGLTRTGGRVGILPLAASATATAEPIDALVGADVLSCCALDIDPDARRFRLLPSGRMPFTGARAPLRLSPDRHVYVGEIGLGRETIRPVLVDTGDGSAATVTRQVWQRARSASGGMTTTLAYGLGGPVVSQMTVVPLLTLGELQARDVEVRIEPPGGFAASTGTTGRIGSGLLLRYRTLLDPRAGHMILAPRTGSPEPVRRSTSGLLLGQQTGRLKVLHVMARSPAARAGWREGELICTVDGADVRAGTGGTADVSWLTGAPGRTVQIGMCDGSTRELVLASFY